MNPLVSVVIPTYNRAGYLDQTLRSARSQTYENLEILVLDDASPDNTEEVVLAHRNEDARIRYVRHEQNKGLVGNWRCGIEAAEGEFFCILGDDDTLEATFVEALIEPLLRDESLTLAFCDHWIIDASGKRLMHKSEENTKRWRRDNLSRGRIDAFDQVALINRSVFIGAVLFRRSALEGHSIPDEVASFIDMWMLYGCAKQGPAYYIPQRHASCRWQEGGVSRSWKWRVYGYEGEIFYYEKLLEDSALSEYHDIFRIRLAEANVGLGSTQLLMGERPSARAAFEQALELQPGMKSRLGYVLSFGGPLASASLSTVRQLRSYFLPPSRPPIYPEEEIPEYNRANGAGSPTSKQQEKLEHLSAQEPA